jgi:hypothetical protein
MKVPKGKSCFCKAMLLGLALAWTGLAGAAELAGRLVFMQGQVAVRLAGTDAWQKARLNQDLAGGDMVRTGPNSRAAILSWTKAKSS